MEEDIYNTHTSLKSALVNQRLKKAIEKGDYIMKYESAHDELLIKALSIVHDFIKRKKRVCYGGTAMNKLLPVAKQFYNPDVDLPDYDFYTPNADEDVEDLVNDLQKAGFTDVHNKVGIHEGTKKILVNFVAVADITYIDPELFTIIYRRSIIKNEVHYTDPDILRMMMYLELSRPHGMISRWEKVFERLKLINTELPIRATCHTYRNVYYTHVPMDIRKQILDYGIKNKRILCNGPLATIYRNGIMHKNAIFNTHGAYPILFVSPDPKEDAVAIRDILKDSDIEVFLHKERGEIVPLRIELRKHDKPICMFIQETACHSYRSIPLSDKRSIRIASLEFLITLYLSIDIFTNTSSEYLGEGILCQVKNFIKLLEKNYRAKHSQFSPFSLKCAGHQVGYASLLKAKFERIKEERDKTLKRKSKKRTITSKKRRTR
jgi:hypothetical protein